jgi:hypothetical protein
MQLHTDVFEMHTYLRIFKVDTNFMNGQYIIGKRPKSVFVLLTRHIYNTYVHVVVKYTSLNIREYMF